MASSSMSEHFNPLQQRAAAAAQALLAPGRSVSQREIQAILVKNEAVLRGWNALHKQQPAKTNPTEHKEWVRRCVTFRQQIGARLEVLALLADKQIAQEGEKSDGQRTSTPLVALKGTETPQKLASPNAAALQVSTTAVSMGPVSTSASMAMPHLAALTPPTFFPEPPMPTVGFASTSSSSFFPTGQTNSMQTSTGLSQTALVAASGATALTHGYSMSAGVQTFTSNACMTPTSRPLSSSAGFVNQQDYMMGNGMMSPEQQHFMPMTMPMNLVSSGGGNMYGYNAYGMPLTPTSANVHTSGNGNSNSSSSNFPVDPFITPLGFSSDVSFGSSGYPVAAMAGMPVHHLQHQVMGPTNEVNFGARMMPNNFGYGSTIGMPTPSSESMMPQPVSAHQFQPTSQPFQQQSQLHQHPTQQIEAELMSLSPDSVLYGENNVNIFEGLTDDAFFPLQ